MYNFKYYYFEFQALIAVQERIHFPFSTWSSHISCSGTYGFFSLLAFRPEKPQRSTILNTARIFYCRLVLLGTLPDTELYLHPTATSSLRDYQLTFLPFIKPPAIGLSQP